jgi:hypothetical protein
MHSALGVGGGLTVSEGASILEDVDLWGDLTVHATTDTTSLNSGSFVVNSGFSVAKTAWFGGDVNAIGNVSAASMSVSGVVTSLSLTVGDASISGGLTVGTVTATVVRCQNSADSVSSTSGALTVSGGMGILKNVHIGGNLFAGVTTMSGVVVSGSSSLGGGVNVGSTADSTSAVTGSIVTTGGVGISKSVTIGGNLSVGGNVNIPDGDFSVDGITSLGEMTTTGLSVTAGASIGGTFSVTGDQTNVGLLMSFNTTDSVSSATGSIVTSGGLGIAKSVTIGGGLFATGTTNLINTSVHGTCVFSKTTDSVSISTGSVIMSGGLGIARSVSIGGDASASGDVTVGGRLSVSSDSVFTSTTDSTTGSNGCVTFSGGIGVTKSVNVNGDAVINGTLSTAGVVSFTNVTDSAATFSGGVKFNRNVNVQGGVTVGGSLESLELTVTSGILHNGTITISDNSGLFTVTSPVPGTRLAATDATKTTQYPNFLDVFTLGNNYVDADVESLQLASSGTSKYVIQSRQSGSGTLRSLTLQAGQHNNITVNTDGTVAFNSTSDSVSLSTGAVSVAGGLSVATSLSVGGIIKFTISSGTVGLRPSGSSSTYNLTLPISPPTTNNSGLVCDVNGNLSFQQSNGNFYGDQSGFDIFTNVTNLGMTISSTGSVNLNCTTDVTSVTSAGLTVTGGAGISKSLIVGSQAQFRSGGGLFTGSANTANVAVKLLAGGSTTGSGLSIDSSNLTGGTNWLITSQSGNGNLIIRNGTDPSDDIIVSQNMTLVLPGDLSIGPVNISSSDQSGNYTLTLPTQLPSGNASKFALVTDTLGNLSFSESIDSNASSWSQSFAAATGVSTPTSIPGLLMPDQSFSIYIFVMQIASVNVNSLFQITAVQQSNGSWVLNQNVLGPTGPLITFSVSSTGGGQIQYQTGDIPGFVSLKFFYDLPSNNNLNQTVFQAQNDTVADVNGLIATERSFVASVLVGVFSTISDLCRNCLVSLEGAKQSDGSWITNQIDTGPVTNVTFSISDSGQIQYASPDTQGWLGTTFRFQNPSPANNVNHDNVTINDSLELYGSATGGVTLRSAPAVVTSYELTLPSIAPPDTGYTLVTTTDASTLGWTLLPSTVPLSFSAANNVTTSSDVTGLSFSTSQFSIYIAVLIVAASSVNALYLIEGIQTPNGEFDLTQTIRAGTPGITFSVSSSGQIQYMSPSIAGWVSTTFQFMPQSQNLQTDGSFDTFTVIGNVDSYSATTGCLQVKGGIGVSKSVHADGGVYSGAANWCNAVWTLGGNVSPTPNTNFTPTDWNIVTGNCSVTGGSVTAPVKGVYAITFNVCCDTSGTTAWLSVTGLPEMSVTTCDTEKYCVMWTGVMNMSATVTPMITFPSAGALLSPTTTLTVCLVHKLW